MILTAETFATGMLTLAFLAAGVFFLRFWRDSRDVFFLAFAISFFIKGGNALAVAFMSKPNEASPLSYIIGLCSSLLIVGAIVHKNWKSR